jgi:hypothetical protein
MSQANRVVLGVVLAAALIGVSSCTHTAAPEPPAAADPHSAHTAKPAGPPAPLRAGERFVSLSMRQPYTPAAANGGTDEYRCFLVDPKLTADEFLTGSQFEPQNAAIVHHAIFFRLNPAQVPTARQVDAQDQGEGWRCFGDAGIDAGAAWVAHWAPGADETVLAPDIGYPMPRGSQLVMQVHYNLLGGTRGADQSRIRLRLTDRTDLKRLDTMLLPAPVELACAPDESGPLCHRAAAVQDLISRFGQRSAAVADQLNRMCNQGQPPSAAIEQHCNHVAPNAGTIYAVAGHMHLLGRSITIELNGRKLLDVPAYNFDEQAVIPLTEPVAVKAGDTVRVSCTHDVALRQRLPQLRNLPPRYVVWGEGTSDEMCLGLIVWSRTE